MATHNLQQSRRPHDIRTAIPLTSMTNPASFPQHVHQDYPKMLLRPNPDFPAKSKAPTMPVVDELDQPIIVVDEDEEQEFLDSHPELAEDIRKATPKSTADRMADDNELIRQMIAEREDLQARLAAAEKRAAAAEKKEAAAPKPSTKPKAAKPVTKGAGLPNKLKGSQ